jgi:surface-anchored protein
MGTESSTVHEAAPRTSSAETTAESGASGDPTPLEEDDLPSIETEPPSDEGTPDHQEPATGSAPDEPVAAPAEPEAPTTTAVGTAEPDHVEPVPAPFHPASDATPDRTPDPRAALRLDAAVSAVAEIDRGHVDLLEVTVSGGRVVMLVKDHTTAGGPTFRAPADVRVRVRDRARTEVPSNEAFRFLGQQGSTVYLLPQTEDRELVWPGWSTERLRPGQVVGDAITWRMRSVDGPGDVTLFTTDQFGGPKVLLSSSRNGPAETRVRANSHAHGNWTFSAPGTYRMTFEVAADVVGAGPTVASAAYVVLVGDGAVDVPPGSSTPPQRGPVAASPTAGAPGPRSAVNGPQPQVAGAMSERGAAAALAGRPSRSGPLASTGWPVHAALAAGVALTGTGSALVRLSRPRRSVRP